MTTDDSSHHTACPPVQKTLIWIIASAGCILGGAAVIQNHFFSNDRFYLIQNGDGTTVEIDRRTGKTWQIHRGRKYEIGVADEAQSLKPIPESLMDQISGTVIKQDDYFQIDFYNGTNWTIEEIIIRVPNTSVGRLYREVKTVSPYSTRRLLFDVGRFRVTPFEWEIAEVRGHPPS